MALPVGKDKRSPGLPLLAWQWPPTKQVESDDGWHHNDDDSGEGMMHSPVAKKKKKPAWREKVSELAIDGRNHISTVHLYLPQ